MSVELDPTGSPVAVGSVTLKTPGLAGTAEAEVPAAPGTRGPAELGTEELESALENERVATQDTVTLSDTAELELGGVQSRSTTYGEPAIEVEAADPGSDFGQVVLYIDEAGVASWNFARDQDLQLDVTRGGATRTYVLRRSVPPPAAPGETRGLAGAAGKKLLKVLVFPLVDPIIGKVGAYFAGKWEAAKRPYRFRTFEPTSFASPNAPEVNAAEWDKLGGGRALLVVHGTLSRTHTAFGRLPLEFVEELHRLYEGRVFAFDHFTLSADPRQNVEWFAQHLPDGISLDLDVVTHSRGGLVGRVLAEKESELSLGSKQVNIRKLVFVAVPNSGTVLTDAKYLGDLIDTYTNLLNFLPDTGVVEVLEGVVTVMKQLAIGTLKGLDGLQAMRPGGPFLKDWLNMGPRDDKRYFAVGSNYEASGLGLGAFRDRLTDYVFEQVQNDLVVPTTGVYDRNGSERFPIEERYLFTGADGVAHTRFFANEVAREKIMGWLAAS
jgi:pimeloyl-ACP methyl ester carboxylesterase